MPPVWEERLDRLRLNDLGELGQIVNPVDVERVRRFVRAALRS